MKYISEEKAKELVKCEDNRKEDRTEKNKVRRNLY